MPYIQNRAYTDIKAGLHIPAKVLIQIVDPSMDWPEPAYNFEEVHKFKFWDTENSIDGAIDDAQAKRLVTILKSAFTKDQDVVVHCVAGICRSGAVVEVGVMIGFQETRAIRIPNLRVKNKMLQQLGWGYE